MASYKITRVSEQPPRVWDNPKGGKIYYIKCMVEGWEKAIEVGKKSPDALHIGDELHGTITATEYPADKFKADPPAFTPGGGGGKSNYTPPDTHAIAKSVALKAAVELYAATDHTKEDAVPDVYVIQYADKFLAWLEADDKETKSEEPHYEDGGF